MSKARVRKSGTIKARGGTRASAGRSSRAVPAPKKKGGGAAPGPGPGPAGLPKDAAALAGMINDYSIVKQPGNNKIVMRHISVLAQLRDVSVPGTLIHKQLAQMGAGGQRTYTPGTVYGIEADGDVHISLGTKENAPHVPCEIQHGHDYLARINGMIGQQMVVSGFFRCLFEHPGFAANVDAHICEIHPVRAMQLTSGTLTFDVARPDPQAIRAWRPAVNTQDAAVKVTYDQASDSATFEKVHGMDTNYVQMSGTIDNIDLKKLTPEPAQCTFASPDIAAGPITVFCLKGTNAAGQLEPLKNGGKVDLLGLRNVDLTEAMNNRYVINMLGIDIQAKP
jgi:hypothetical protein